MNGNQPPLQTPSKDAQSISKSKVLLKPNTVTLRTFVVAIAAAVATLAYLIVGWKDTWFGVHVSRGQAVWSVASAEIVAAIYKWGVGSLSRYTPPAEAHMKDGPPPTITTPIINTASPTITKAQP